jgi:putative transposase
VHSWRHVWPVEMLCRVMQVSTRGYRSWHTRPTSRRSRGDMKVLTHIREQYGLSLGSDGRPRMTMELKETGLNLGERRVGRLMRTNGIRPVRTRKHKVTTNSNHRLGIAANWLDGDFVAATPNQNGQATSPTYGLPRVGSTSLLFLIYTAAVSLTGRSATE